MKKHSLSLLCLGIASGLLLSAEVQAFSTFPGQETTEAIAALSWTCRSCSGGYQAPEMKQPAPAEIGDYEAVEPEVFYRQLDAEGKQLYNSMPEEGKQLAQRLSRQYPNKTQAVREAAKYHATGT